MVTESRKIVDKTKNQINTIHPFLKHNVWVFTDEDVELYEEPFVGNVNPIIESVVEGTSFTAHISHSYIGGEQLVLDKIDDVENGADIGDGWYQLRGTKLACWLCPATLKYFEDYPKEIHVRIEK